MEGLQALEKAFCSPPTRHSAVEAPNPKAYAPKSRPWEAMRVHVAEKVEDASWRRSSVRQS